MLVYCSLLSLEPKNAVDQVLGAVARWAGQKTGSFIDPGLLRGDHHQRLRDGSMIDSVSSSVQPACLCAVSFTHRDDRVSGRQWTTEIGIRQEALDRAIKCSILLRTSEVSARVIEPIQVTRPRIVEYLVKDCSPSQLTPGLHEIRLSEDNAQGFPTAVEDERRSAPYVLISPTADQHYLVDPARLSSLLVGIADIVVIPKDADTFEIERLVGPRYSAYRGAVNVLFAPRRLGQFTSVDCVRLLPDQLAATYGDGGSPESEVLSIVTHRTSLPNSWRHVSPETVMRERLRVQLSTSIAKARASSLSQQEYIELLQVADSDMCLKDKELASLQQDIEERDAEVRRLEYETEALKSALAARGDEDRTNDTQPPISFAAFRDTVDALQRENPSLEQSLQLVRALYPERVTVLDSAFTSARASAGFKHKLKAFHLLWKLITSYWEAMRGRGGDAIAKQVFGEAFAAREAESISKQGIKRRTFPYNGQQVEMFKHLRIGIKDSASETLRIYFYWDAKDQRIVIGHCGKHLDF